MASNVDWVIMSLQAAVKSIKVDGLSKENVLKDHGLRVEF